MPNNCLSELYKRIIQVENKNVGLKVGGGGAQTYHCPPNQKSGGGHMPPLPPPPPLPTPVHIYIYIYIYIYREREREREMFYLTTHSKHFIYSYMASDIWLRTILIVRKETRCRHIGYSYRLTARVLLYASHRQDNTYHGLCYTSRGVLAGTRNSSMGPPHEESIRRPIAP